MKEKSLYFLSACFFTFLFSGVAYAVNPLNTTYTKGLGSTKYGENNATVGTVIVDVINFFLGITAALAVLVIIVSGILYITSGGDADRASKAKTWIMYAIVGIIVVLIAYVIVYSVSNVFSMTS